MNWNSTIWIFAIFLVQNAFADQAAIKSNGDSKKLVTESKSSSVSSTSSKNHKSSGSNSKPVIIVASKTSTSESSDKPNWFNWTPVPENSANWLPAPKTTPLTHAEQEKRILAQMQRAKVTQSTGATGGSSYYSSHYTKGAKKQKKPANPNPMSSYNFSPLGLDEIRGRMMSFSKILFDYMGIENPLLSSGSEPQSNYHVEEGKSNSGNSYASQYHYESYGGAGGAEGGQADKGGRLLKWLSRLIGVEGKSLGEFLREYQVHVLYDLVFTFFKWIFFLYAGLLIP